MTDLMVPVLLGSAIAAVLMEQSRRKSAASSGAPAGNPPAGAPPGAPPAGAPPSGAPPASSKPNNGRPPMSSLPGRWVWPVPIWRGRKPVISSGWGTPRGTQQHEGADVMFRRLPSDPYPVRSPNGSKGFVLPEGVFALAAADGKVWSAGWTPRGFSVVLDHGELGKIATYYTHLQTLLLQPTARGRSGQRVIAGQPLGIIGADPKDSNGLKHLHFAIWLGGPRDAVDPEPLMRSWAMVRSPDEQGGAAGGYGPGPKGGAPGSSGGAKLQGPVTMPSASPRNAPFQFQPVGSRGERYPEWVRALRGKSGVYVIRELASDGDSPEIVYVGQSQAGRLYETLTRHFQGWNRRKTFWRGQYSANDPGLTYPRHRVDVAVKLTAPSRALDEEARMIQELRPRDNVIGQPDEPNDRDEPDEREEAPF